MEMCLKNPIGLMNTGISVVISYVGETEGQNRRLHR